MHKAIFEVIENTDIQFPLIRVKNFLVDQGFTFKEYESTEEILILSRNGKRAIVCLMQLVFRNLRIEKRKNLIKFSTLILYLDQKSSLSQLFRIKRPQK